MNKEIEELAEVIIKASCYGSECDNCSFVKCVEEASNCCVCLKALYNAGYKKIPKRILANKTYSDSTLKFWTKEQLIEEIRILQHNWNAAEESLNIQAKAFEKLLEEQK